MHIYQSRLGILLIALGSAPLLLAQGADRTCAGKFSGPPWLAQNYRHADVRQEPAQPTSPAATDRLLAQLADLQHTTIGLERYARFSDDLYAALAAVGEARTNVELMAALGSRPAQSAAAQSPVFLIALKDGTVHAALAYWAEGGVLHYITPQGKQEQAELAALDRRLTEQLNRERNLEMQLPPAQ